MSGFEEWERLTPEEIFGQEVRADQPKAPALTSWTSPAQTEADEAASIERAVEFNVAVNEEIRRQRIREEARRRITAATRPPWPDVLSLTNALALDDDAPTWRIDGAMPRDGITLFFAPQKAGKTTAVGNLVRSLVDGDKFLGAFDVRDVGTVALIDTESGDRRLRQWLRDQQIRETGAVRLISLRGREASLDPRDPACRAWWAATLDGVDTVILDVIGPVLASLGLDESNNADVGAFWTGYRSLLVDAGIPSSVVVHHTGHDERRAIGASAWLRYPDVIWRLEREDDDPTSQRYFSAYGRDVEIWQGALTYDALTRRLTYQGGSKSRTVAGRNVAVLVDLLREQGPQNATHCVDLLRGAVPNLSRDAARPVPMEGLRQSALIMWRQGKAEIFGVSGVHVPPP